MAISVVMPALELTQETGKLVSWRKKEGEAVAKGETLLEVETDKAVVEVEALADGFLAGVKAKEGDVIAVGRTIAWIVDKGESAPADEAPAAAASTTAAVTAPRAAESAAPSADAAISGARVKISPKARRLASRTSRQSRQRARFGRRRRNSRFGHRGRSKILGGATARCAPSSGAKLETLTSIGRLMAERTTQSWTTVPHFFLVREVDASALHQTREKLAASAATNSGVKITHTDLLTALVARVLLQHPRMNASWTPMESASTQK